MATVNQLATHTYDRPRKWIIRKRNEEKTWGFIESPDPTNGVDSFLNSMQYVEDWPDMSSQDWALLVSLVKSAEEKNLLSDKNKGQAIVIDGSSENGLKIPTDDDSAWQLYRKKLLAKGFNEGSVGEIERASHKILKRLSLDATNSDPVKGLVIGNVQSGKTANMAALMAMAADNGWNMFVILSGTIENLREQTRSRLYGDLNSPGNLNWIMLDQLARGNKCPFDSRPHNLQFNGTNRYFVVCLKNSSRLKNLIKWFQWDENAQKQMKVLVIEDEADQASINTGDVERDDTERKAINKAVCALVNGYDENHRNPKGCFGAMNYVGYTATPYANLLNESSRKSLYPRNFISTLTVSDEYFGPQQIFGGEATEYDGLDIVRIVEQEEIVDIKEIHTGSLEIPTSLEKSICWFICSVAAMRYNGYKEPVSMLMHTSQKVDHHSNLSSAVLNWFNTHTFNEILDLCKDVWVEETAEFTADTFKEQYPNYGRIEQLQDYPAFDAIQSEIFELLKKVAPIQVDDNGEYQYHLGIHLCVDNSVFNKQTSDEEMWRLKYPSKENMPVKAPAFIVIGGATLSRGLTIEGLVSTFFMRTVKQADTLMQMGRWFGYRKGYELYPRLWISANTKEQFEFLSTLDIELRKEILWMETTGNQPDSYAVKLENSPRLNLIKLSAANRTQNMIEAELDFSGASNQTYIFDEDENILKANLELTKRFIIDQGQPEVRDDVNTHAASTHIWRNVDFSVIKDYLKSYRFSERLSVFNNIDPFIEWIEEMTAEGNLKEWNVILSGKSKTASGSSPMDFGNISINKILRSRKKLKKQIDGVINVGVISNPSDMIADIDLSKQPNDYVERFKREKSNEKSFPMLRFDAGMGNIPQLFLYIVDKNSKAPEETKTRVDLNAKADIAGLWINIPGAPRGSNYVTKVTIRLEHEELDIDD